MRSMGASSDSEVGLCDLFVLLRGVSRKSRLLVRQEALAIYLRLRLLGSDCRRFRLSRSLHGPLVLLRPR